MSEHSGLFQLGKLLATGHHAAMRVRSLAFQHQPWAFTMMLCLDCDTTHPNLRAHHLHSCPSAFRPRMSIFLRFLETAAGRSDLFVSPDLSLNTQILVCSWVVYTISSPWILNWE